MSMVDYILQTLESRHIEIQTKPISLLDSMSSMIISDMMVSDLSRLIHTQWEIL